VTAASQARPNSPRDDLRIALERLAALDGGRRLLQLAVRGLERGGAELDAGCWTRRGDAGCLFQHAYWEGVRAGEFGDDGDARAWVSRVAGRTGWSRVIDAIAAFDRLARSHYRTERRTRLALRAPAIDRAAWRTAVLGMLVEALAESPTGLATRGPQVVEYAKL
jgi:hypothetical protein